MDLIVRVTTVKLIGNSNKPLIGKSTQKTSTISTRPFLAASLQGVANVMALLRNEVGRSVESCFRLSTAWDPAVEETTEETILSIMIESVWIDRSVVRGLGLHDIQNLVVATMLDRMAVCLAHGADQNYTDRSGNRSIQMVSNVDAAPCFWPVPFDEKSITGPTPKSWASNFAVPNAPITPYNPTQKFQPIADTLPTPVSTKCDCGGSSVGGGHSSWCSTQSKQTIGENKT